MTPQMELGRSSRRFDRSLARSEHTLWNKCGRGLWGIVWCLLFRPSPRPLHAWRRLLLKVFGARIDRGAKVASSCRIWAPWNLEMGRFSCLGEKVDCYCVGRIRLGNDVVVSQYSYLCSATHDPSDPRFKLVTAPITIEDQAWVAADVFVGPGVTVGEGSVVGARASAYKDVPAWTIVGGNPAKPIRKRELRGTSALDSLTGG